MELGDALRVQLQVRWQLPEGMEPSSRLLYEAVAYRAEQGEDAPRFRTRILRWQNPGRLTAGGRSWRQGNQADAWDSLGPAIAAFARSEMAAATVQLGPPDQCRRESCGHQYGEHETGGQRCRKCDCPRFVP